jgi:hypothetical protein
VWSGYSIFFALPSPSKNLRFNHPALSKVTIATKINENINVRAQTLSAKERNEI